LGNDDTSTTGRIIEPPYPPSLFFASQIVTNACATQAILSIALNHPLIDVGNDLREFLSRVEGLNAVERGQQLAKMDLIRRVHNSFARPSHSLFASDYIEFTESSFPAASSSYSKRRNTLRKRGFRFGDNVECFHFTSFVPVNGRVLELDGLQRGPIDHGSYSSAWEKIAIESIKKRLVRFESSEIRFNLMAVINDRIDRWNAQIVQLTSLFQDLQDPDAEIQRAEVSGKVAKIRSKINEEMARRHSDSVENVRRRFDYTNFIRKYFEILLNSENGISKCL
jgi:ubiquitin carboxyl-terminal hydrolase L5